MVSQSDPDYLDSLLSNPVLPETYADWLKKGLGRAVLLLDRHDPRVCRLRKRSMQQLQK
jgi:hypothetical protein